MRFIAAFFSFIGRICIAAVFVGAGFHKVLNWDSTLEFMQAHGLTEYTQYLALGAIIVEILGGLSFAFGYIPKLGATLLALFLIPTTYFFHNFWTMADPQMASAQQIEFFKNLAIFGGLVCYIAASQGTSKPASKPTEK